jgi:hypothetical protein
MKALSPQFGYLSIQTKPNNSLIVNLQTGIDEGRILHNGKPLVEQSDELRVLDSKVREPNRQGDLKTIVCNDILKILTQTLKDPVLLLDLFDLIQPKNAIVNQIDSQFPQVSFNSLYLPSVLSGNSEMIDQLKRAIAERPQSPMIISTQGPAPIGKSFYWQPLSSPFRSMVKKNRIED